MNDPIRLLLIGAGNRGSLTFGKFAKDNPDLINFVGLAEPNLIRREKFARIHGLNDEVVFETWEELLDKPKFADAVIIATQDRLHTEPTLKALEKYHVLLEKPMAPSKEECQLIVQEAEKKEKILMICHVLRYTNFFSKVKEAIETKIGDLVNISLRENVSYWHYAHSFIRGNWHNRENSSPMILAKSCHDLDILYWLTNSKPKLITSFGSQNHFGIDNAPEGATDRCTDNCPAAKSCLYYAPRFYCDQVPLLQIGRKAGNRYIKFLTFLILDHPKLFNQLSKIIPPLKRATTIESSFVSAITDNPTPEGKLKALRNGPYGRCVYKISDHDVVDHQIVSIEFENNVTATFTMHGHSYEEGRTIRVDGTKGTLKGAFLISGDYLTFYNSATNKKEVLIKSGLDTTGHGGGDAGLLKAFVKVVKQEQTDPLTSGRASLESHLMAFAADESRVLQKIIKMDQFK